MNANQVAEILLEKKIPQGRLFNLGDFIHFVNERGIASHGLERKTFEFWDRSKLLRPIIKVQSVSSHHLITERLPHAFRYDPASLNRRLKRGEEATTLYHHWYLEPHLLEDLREHKAQRLVNLDSRWFQNWAHFDDANGQMRVTYWYHPFHITRLREILRHCELDVRFPEFKVFPLDRTVGKFYRGFRKVLNSIQSAEAKFLKQLSLIVAIEDRYLPEIRRHIRHADQNPNWDSWSKSFDCDSVLKKTTFSLSGVREILNELAWQWHDLNELGDWHLLIRHSDYEARKQLRGKPRLACDYYEFAEMVRLFLRDATKKVQPNLEQIVSVGDQRAFLRPDPQQPTEILVPSLLRQFQLDPRYQILLAVEGEAEEAFVKAWCEHNGINLKRLGVKVFPFSGTSGLKSPHVRLELKNARDTKALVFLTVDDENNARQDLQVLVQDKLVEAVHPVSELRKPRTFPIGAFVWTPCFEDANFTADQIASAWVAAAERLRGFNSPTISEKELLNKMTQRHSAAGTWIKALFQVVGKRTPVTKPQLATELARLSVETDCDFTRLIRHVIAQVR